jgi:hypothetical protein
MEDKKEEMEVNEEEMEGKRGNYTMKRWREKKKR